MAYALSATEQAMLADLAGLIRGTISSSSFWPEGAYVGKYYLAYEYLAEVQVNSSTGTLKPGSNDSVYLWLNAAADVNQGVGEYSTFIREYTKQQYLLRTGNPIPDVQEQSNGIAEAVINDVLTNGRLPDLESLGFSDAGGVVGSLYGNVSDFSSWSGALLFVPLGSSRFYTEHILDELNGTYDLLALIESAKHASGQSFTSLTGVLTTFLDVLGTAIGNDVGVGPTFSLFGDVAQNSNSFFKEHYLQTSGLSIVFGPDITLGRNTSQGDELDGWSDADIIHGGAGDDLVRWSTDSDFLDGGADSDTLDYSDFGSKLTVLVKSAPNGDLGLLVTKDRQGQDRAAGFETLKLGARGDMVSVDENLQRGHLKIDAGGQGAGEQDILDLSRAKGSVTITKDPGTGTFRTEKGDAVIEFDNFEVIRGSKHNDTLHLNDDGHVVVAGRGNDEIITGDGADLIEVDGGSDLIQSGGGADRIVLGDGESAFITDGDPSDRLFIRMRNGDSITETLIPILGGMVLHAGWEDPSGSTFTNDEYFSAEFFSTYNDEPLVGSFSQNLYVSFSRDGANLVISIDYEGVGYSVLLVDYQEGDFGLTFGETINPFFTDGVEAWEQEGLAGLRAKAEGVLSQANFSEAELPSEYESETAAEDSDPVSGSDSDDTMSGTDAAEHFNGAGGWNTVSYANASDGVAVDRTSPALSSGDAAFDSFENIQSFVLSGFGDYYYGGADTDIVIAGAGDDVIDLGDGDDVADGGAGADYIEGGEGWDLVSFASASAAVVLDRASPQFSSGDAAGDVYSGVEGFELTSFSDTFVGSEDDEDVYGADGDDTLNGNGGNDTLAGGAGANTLIGGAGDDRFFLDVGIDQVEGDAGWDTISFAGSSEAVVINMGLPSANAGAAAGDVYSGVEEIELTDGDDVFIGSGGGIVVRGSGGNDQFFLGDGVNVADGGEGDDAIYGGAGDDHVDGTDGADTLSGGSGSDFLDGGAGNDVLEGGVGNDILRGGEGRDTLSYRTSAAGVVVALALAEQNTLGSGTDQTSGFEDLQGSAFGDVLEGDLFGNSLAGLDGSDTFRFMGLFGHDTVVDFAFGSDTLAFASTTFTDRAALISASSQVGGDVLIDAGPRGSVTLSGMTLQQLDTIDLQIVAIEGEPDLVKGANVANVDLVSAISVAGAFDLEASSDIVDSTFIPHATIRGTASGLGIEYYRVLGLEGGRLILDIDGASFDTILLIADENGNNLYFNDDNDQDAGSTSQNSFIDFTIPADGTYYIGVSSAGSWMEGPPAGGEYTLHISAQTPEPVPETVDKPTIVKPSSVVNTSIGTAVSLNGAFDLVESPTIEASTEIPHASIAATASGQGSEYYSFTATAGSLATFDIDGANFDTIIDLFNSSGQLLGSNDDSYSDPGSTSLNSFLRYNFSSDGTYYLRVKEYGQGDDIRDDGTYQLHVSVQGAPVEYIV
jgi:Ca2+-binding RTX toxin-like protein